MRNLRADSQFYTASVIAACRRADARSSFTTGMKTVRQTGHREDCRAHLADDQLPEHGGRPDTGELIFNAGVAEIPPTPRSPAARSGKQALPG